MRKMSYLEWNECTFYCVVITLLMHSCIPTTKTPYSLDIQGHRGARAVYPENSIAGFIYALETGVTTLEMDVVISKNEKVVLSHEPWMSHEICISPHGDNITAENEKRHNIYQMNYEEIRLFDCGSKLHQRFPHQKKIPVYKPLLEEVIDTIEQLIAHNNLWPVRYNIETKCTPEGDDRYHPRPEVFASLLMKVILHKGIANRTVIQSFDIRTLQYIHLHYPQQKTALLVSAENNVSHALQLLNFTPYALSPHYSLVNKALKKLCAKKDMKLIVWTVNDDNEASRMLDLKVDGIISDNPKIIIDLAQKRNISLISSFSNTSKP